MGNRVALCADVSADRMKFGAGGAVGGKLPETSSPPQDVSQQQQQSPPTSTALENNPGTVEELHKKCKGSCNILFSCKIRRLCTRANLFLKKMSFQFVSMVPSLWYRKCCRIIFKYRIRLIYQRRNRATGSAQRTWAIKCTDLRK